MEPLMDCNLPELLAVDLKTPDRNSRPTSSVSRPPKSLAAGENRAMAQSQVHLDSSTTPDERELLSKMRSLELLDKKYSELLALGEELMKEVSDSELSGSDSSGYIVPPCIRTRNISVTTAATSVASARNRSGSIFNSASTSPQRKEPPRSWLDSEDGSSEALFQSRAPTVLTPQGPIISPPRRSSKRYARTQNSFWSPAPTSESYIADPFAGFGGEEDDSYDTVSALPSYSDAHETSASRMQNFGTDRIAVSSPRDRFVTQKRRVEGSPRSPPSPTSFVPSAYDAEDTPTKSYLSQSRNPRSRMASTQYRQPDDILEDVESQQGFSDTSASRENSFVTPRRDDVRPESISIETWFQAVIDDFAHPFDAELEAPASRIPIPAEVLETLRVSVSCFPETMLLCSSLSIETIRSHVRKVKYEGKGCQELKSAAQISSILDEKPKASAWRKFTSMTRRTPATDGATTRVIGSSSAASQHVTSFGLEREKSTWPNSSLDWVSIKSVFPNGTDYLCDALYAHLLTYNYIDSLCPRAAAPAASVLTPRPRTANDSTDAASPRSSSSGQGNSKIPRKAASFLGLHNNSGVDGPVLAVPVLLNGRRRGASVSSTMSRTNTTDVGRNVLRGKRSYGSHGLQRPVWDESDPTIPRMPLAGKRRPLMGSIISTTPVHTPRTMSRQRGTTVASGNIHARTAATLAAAAAASKLSSAEQSLLDLRAGLLTCITRLIVTLQTTSSYGDDRNEEVSAIVSLADDGADEHYGAFYHDGSNGNSKRYGSSNKNSNNSSSQNDRGEKKRKDTAVDPFLMRSLCELVRVGESKGCQD
ncbi:hypothetical protein MN608_02516 [Microdochium nivale]|nr:hypothetical protein MN608_02516 [Microdochium nivale]